MAAGLADHFLFEDFGSQNLVKEFDTVFQIIQGERHRFTKLGGMDWWLRFVFRRWFLIGEFIRQQGIDSFWTFDSDTILLANLSQRAERLSDFDATIQCKGACLNGWIGSADLVERYNRFTIGLFKDEAFLQAQQERLKVHAGLAFNEMDAFSEFSRCSAVSTFHAQKPCNGEAFDDALAFVQGFEPALEKLFGRTKVKRLWSDCVGRVFARGVDGTFVRLLSCNMSWMPIFLWKRLMAFPTPEDRPLASPPEITELNEISYREPLSSRLVSTIYSQFHRPNVRKN